MPPRTPNDTILTDDYVAQVLSKEAGDCSMKYSSLGLDAYKSQKRPAHQPKPNTRFLNSIIRDTNSHNRALLAKENAESQAKLKTLDRPSSGPSSRPASRDTRSRMLGDIAAILGAPGSSKNTRSSASTDPSNARVVPRNNHSNKDKSRDGEKRRHTERGEDEGSGTHGEDRSSRRHRHHRRDHRHDNRSRSPPRHRGHRHDHNRDRQVRERDRSHGQSHSSRRSRRSRSRSPGLPSSSHRDRSPKISEPDCLDDTKKSMPLATQLTRATNPVRGDSVSGQGMGTDSDSDSDPLEDLIGPAPPVSSAVRRRGRGVASTSGIDGRFASNYDPSLDISLEADDLRGAAAARDDWDGAVEAFRDRQKWKRQGADRLRAAGFTEDQISKWEKGDQKDETDVRWNKPGGTREWDRGKVVQDDGHVAHEADWGRLKGT